MVAVITTFAADARRLIIISLRFADVQVVFGAGIFAYWARHGTIDVPDVYVTALLVGAFLTATCMHFTSLYSFANLVTFSLQFGKVTAIWGGVFVTLIGLAYFTQVSDSFSRFWVVTWFTTTLILFGILRTGLAYQVERWAKRGELDLNIAIVGTGEPAAKLVRHLEATRSSGTAIVGMFSGGEASTSDEIAGYPLRGDVDDLLVFIRNNRVDEIIVAVPWRDDGNIREITAKLQTVAADVKLSPEEISLELPHLGYGEVAGIPMLKLSERPLSGWSVFAKGLEDRILGALLLVVFSPLFIAVAIAIKLNSKGSVLFIQKRYGFNNNEFSVLKFRTMRAAPEPAPRDGVVQAQREDPRVTAVGKFLRRTSLDELPQLVNVVRGEMSLVGPRPHAIAHNEEYATVINEYLSRHRVKPGITGWAQINGFRGETQTLDLMRQRVQHDLYYIENWSVLFDLRILVMTLFVGFIHRNAY
jgi:Undecaprenyl-phosphate glucose phosphotransferase